MKSIQFRLAEKINDIVENPSNSKGDGMDMLSGGFMAGEILEEFPHFNDIESSNRDYLFITEMLNDLGRRGMAGGWCKTFQMLKDWREEIGDKKTFPNSKKKKVHAKINGKNNW